VFDTAVDAGPEENGVCHGSTDAACPAPRDGWLATASGPPNPDLPLAAACLVMQGTTGCDWEQHLSAMARGLTREDQLQFVRDGAVLAVVAAADEDDCSMRDGAALFAEEEVQDVGLGKVYLACGEHPEHLFEPPHYYDLLTGLKRTPDDVIFAAFVGVPYPGEDPEGAAACQGSGDEIALCLAQEAMSGLPTDYGDGLWGPKAACYREGVTTGWPGIRFVELATEFGTNGYVYSICNEDWTPAFVALGEMIRGKLE